MYLLRICEEKKEMGNDIELGNCNITFVSTLVGEVGKAKRVVAWDARFQSDHDIELGGGGGDVCVCVCVCGGGGGRERIARSEHVKTDTRSAAL